MVFNFCYSPSGEFLSLPSGQNGLFLPCWAKIISEELRINYLDPKITTQNSCQLFKKRNTSTNLGWKCSAFFIGELDIIYLDSIYLDHIYLHHLGSKFATSSDRPRDDCLFMTQGPAGAVSIYQSRLFTINCTCCLQLFTMSYTKCIQAFVMRNATVPIVNIPEEKRKRKKSDKKLDKNYLFQK